MLIRALAVKLLCWWKNMKCAQVIPQQLAYLNIQAG